MADTKSQVERSRNMAAIRSKDTKPELYLRKLLFSRGYRYRKNVKYIYGHPDIFMAKYNTAVFVNGCFWHRHEGCRYAYMPKSRVEYWYSKFMHNIARDAEVRQMLADQRVKCLVVWECTIKKMRKDERVKEDTLDQIAAFLNNDSEYMAI